VQSLHANYIVYTVHLLSYVEWFCQSYHVE
jgi:hypothetical protein